MSKRTPEKTFFLSSCIWAMIYLNKADGFGCNYYPQFCLILELYSFSTHSGAELLMNVNLHLEL